MLAFDGDPDSEEVRTFRVIPVLDLKAGRVVQAIAGDRENYQPLRSPLDEPATCLNFFTQQGYQEFYLADLDALEECEPQWDVYRKLIKPPFQFWLDAGIKTWDVLPRYDANVTTIVASESLQIEGKLQESLLRFGPDRVAFSLDLKRGELITSMDRWKRLEVIQVVEEVASYGVKKFILLDLAAVGMGKGVPTRELVRSIRHQFPQVELLTGGGVSSQADIDAVEAAGADGVLVSTYLRRTV